MSIDSKKLFLINYLYNHDDWVTSNEISVASQMSVRSVKTYISEINKEFKCIVSSKNGYLIDKTIAKGILSQTNDGSIPLTYEERKSYIFTKVILDKENPTLDELCDYFCISPSTMDNLITRMRSDLKKDNLVMNVKNDVIYINGSNEAISHATMQIIRSEADEFYFSLSKLQNVFNDLDLTEIRHVVTSVLNEYNYYLDDYTLLNYILHLALVIELNQPSENDEDVFDVPMALFSQQPHTLDIVRKIYYDLKNIYNTSYTFTNVYQASILMMTRIVSSKVDEMTYNEVERFVGNDIFELLNDIILKVKNNYGLDLSNERFLVRFAFHLKNLKSRLEGNISISDFQFSTIKNEYPLLYDIACFVASIISEHFHYSLPEDEISYIALHIGLLIEEHNAIENKVTTIVVCPTYINYSFTKDFTKRLTTIFSDSLFITEINSVLEKELNLEDVDLIITTEKINTPIGVRQVVVSPTLSEKNIKSIFDVIEVIKAEKKNAKLKTNFLDLFNEDLFFLGTEFSSSNEAIEMICDQMLKKGYVDEHFKQGIYNREKISACSYNNIAIPHPLDFYSDRPSIAVAINKEKFKWGENEVKLILLLSLNNEYSEKLRDFFDFVFTRLNSEEFYNQLTSVKSYDEFVEVLFSSQSQ